MTSTLWNRLAAAPRTVSLAALALLNIAFVPLARFLDDRFPGPHMGFHLAGIWVMGLLPVSAGLAIATLVLTRRNTTVPGTSRGRFLSISLVIYLVIFLLFLFDYRCGGPF